MSEIGVRVFMPVPFDETYFDGATEEPWARFRETLEVEYGGQFRFTSIGTGAALPSYFIELASDPLGTALKLFFLGHVIKQGIEGWSWMYTQLSKFFHHEPTFDREGAAILVYKAIVDKMDGVPKSFEERGFVVQHAYADPPNLPDPGPLTTIEPPPERVEQAHVYVFQVVADGRDFRVAVDGHNVKFLQE